MKIEKDYLIRALVIVEKNYLSLLEIITNCNIFDIAMLRRIAYIKFLNLEFKHIIGKNNLMVDMLSQAWYEQEEDLIDDTEDIDTTFYSKVHQVENRYPK